MGEKLQRKNNIASFLAAFHHRVYVCVRHHILFNRPRLRNVAVRVAFFTFHVILFDQPIRIVSSRIHVSAIQSTLTCQYSS